MSLEQKRKTMQPGDLIMTPGGFSYLVLSEVFIEDEESEEYVITIYANEDQRTFNASLSIALESCDTLYKNKVK